MSKDVSHQSTIEIEIDGKKLNVPQGSMIIEAADNAGIKTIPRFCYHKKLSVAANCRMCLVEVEKSAKPLPACATPVTAGMKVYTQSPKARDGQKSVMEFLLINHPLDCPICDQGGACELQDLSLTYGNDFSRYEENKRSVADENLGSLIATDMTRCIQCTRCVRYGQEIAGFRELGTIGRGDRMEIGTYLKSHAMRSEISGNVIDLCPVGALTSKPFRFTARAWELSQAESIACHDGLGSNVYVHIRNEKVMRVVPKENEEINETWISDRDRFSYQGLYSDNRLNKPLIKIDEHWMETDWPTAIDAVIKVLDRILGSEIAAFASPNSTLEECYLLQKWMRKVSCPHIDHRIHEMDVTHDQSSMPLYPSLNIKISEIQDQDLIIIIGSHINHENPLIAQRIRKAYLQGAKIICINPADFEFAFDCVEKNIVSFEKMFEILSTENCWENYFNDVEVGKKIILLGELALNHGHANEIRFHLNRLAEKYQASLGMITYGANSAGAWLAGAIPHRKPMGESAAVIGYSVKEALEAQLNAYILLNIDPQIDLAHAILAEKAFKNAKSVIALSAFKTPALLDYATIILPISLFAENEGTYVNMEGKFQLFKAAVPSLGDSRPAWKILRVLGGFDYYHIQEVQSELKHMFDNRSHLHISHTNIKKHAKLNHEIKSHVELKLSNVLGFELEYITEWSIYQSDPLVRQSSSLQSSLLNHDCKYIRLNQTTALKYESKISQLSEFQFKIDNHIADNCLFIPAGLNL